MLFIFVQFELSLKLYIHKAKTFFQRSNIGTRIVNFMYIYQGVNQFNVIPISLVIPTELNVIPTCQCNSYCSK